MARNAQRVQLSNYRYSRADAAEPFDCFDACHGYSALHAQAESFQALRNLRGSTRLLEPELRMGGDILRQRYQVIAPRLDDCTCSGLQVGYLRFSQVELQSGVYSV